MRLISISKATAADLPSDIFARFSFSTEISSHDAGDRDFIVPLPLADQPGTSEIWRFSGESRVEQDGPMKMVVSDDYLLVGLSLAEESPVDQVSRQAYDLILQAIFKRGFCQVVKAWNYLGGINVGNADTERYKQFCVGRAASFREYLPAGHQIPAGTAIGSPPGMPMTIFALAAAKPGLAIENPRQMSAYRYPRQYGPRSPSFSRAALLENTASSQVFLSGTAAIVGHQSLHGEDLDAQLEETIANLDTLLDAARESGSLSNAPDLAAESVLRVYVRRPEWVPDVKARIDQLLGDSTRAIYMIGDICRRELEVEIDGIVTTPQPAIAPTAA